MVKRHSLPALQPPMLTITPPSAVDYGSAAVTPEAEENSEVSRIMHNAGNTLIAIATISRLISTVGGWVVK